MTPRRKQYESDAERQKAYRERKKQKQTLTEKIKAGIMNLFNGNGNNHKPTDDTTSIPSTDTRSKPNLEPKSNQSSVEETLNPKIIRSSCLYCNAQMGYSEAKEDERCEFCRQFNCKEQALYEHMIAQRLARVNNSRDYDLYEKYLKELRSDWQCSRCKLINRYWTTKCSNCGESNHE